jgi:hypothetical protein
MKSFTFRHWLVYSSALRANKLRFIAIDARD